MDSWLHNELKTDVETFVFEKPFYGEDVVEIEKIKDYVRAYYNKKHGGSWGVWHIYAWQKWAYNFVLN